MSKKNMILNGNGLIIEMPKIRPVVQSMLDIEGVYIARDTAHPEAEVPLVSMGGKIYCLQIDKELDPTRFHDTAIFSGPFRAP
jgi:hypothetical protein